jgi:hypothetical protein
MWRKVWRFWRDEKNQKMLSLIGGGFAIAIGGLWAAFVHFNPASDAKQSSPQKHIEADCSSVAIGGDVSGSTITADRSAGCR